MAGTKASNTAKRNLILLGLLILIIIIVVLYLFSTDFGIFTSVPAGGFLPCVPLSDFLCTNPSLSYATGNLSVTLGENLGSNWNNVYFVFVPHGTQIDSNGVPEVSFNVPNATYLSSMQSGNTGITAINLFGAKPGALTKGQQVTGSIWAKYMINGTNQTSYAQIASVNVKAS